MKQLLCLTDSPISEMAGREILGDSINIHVRLAPGHKEKMHSMYLDPRGPFVLFAWPFLKQLTQKRRIPLLLLYQYAVFNIAVPQAVSGNIPFLHKCCAQ